MRFDTDKIIRLKKIINGVRYDTDKATEIGFYQSPQPSSDFQYWSASLYVTPQSGRYFLAGTGGPLTIFAKSTGVAKWASGSDIKILTKKEALQFAERYLKTREIEKFFGDIIEDA